MKLITQILAKLTLAMRARTYYNIVRACSLRKKLAVCLGLTFIFSTNLLAADTPISTDPTSVMRLTVLAALASGDNSFSKVFPSQVSQLSAITTALTTAITPNGASKPNPPINNFMPAWLNDQNCSNPGDCALKYIPLALALFKLNNYPQVVAAQYSILMANLFYAGANANLANNQLLNNKATQKIALLLPKLTTAMLANFFVPNATYADLALDPDSGILVKTPSGTPTGTASQFCTDLVTANVLDFQSTPTMPLTVNNVWLGAICTDSTQCCGNNICNTTSGANLRSTLGSKPYGYCDQPPCTSLGKQPTLPADCCADLVYSNIMDTCLTPVGAACEPPASATDLNPCLVGYVCDGGYCLPTSGVQCFTPETGQNLPGFPIDTPLCANNLSCDIAPLMNYCCNILNDSCSNTNDCCSIFDCDLSSGTSPSCKYMVGQSCAGGNSADCMPPYVCKTSSQNMQDVCCGQTGAGCLTYGDNDCCAGYICNLTKAGDTAGTCIAALPLGANCGDGHTSNCEPGLVCDPCTDKCVSESCEGGCAALNEPCHAQTDCCGTNCYNKDCVQMLTCAFKNAHNQDDSSCMASADPDTTCVGTCQLAGGFGSTCYGIPMCNPTDAAGKSIDNVICSNFDNLGGAGICCLPTSPMACLTDPVNTSGCLPGCTQDTDCCDDIAYRSPISAPATYTPTPAGLSTCVKNSVTGQSFCQTSCLLLGALCGPSAPKGPNVTYDENAQACPGLNPGDPRPVSCMAPTKDSASIIYFAQLPIGAPCNDPGDCITNAMRPTETTECCADANATVCNTNPVVTCKQADDCTLPATCRSVVTSGVCCVPGGSSTCTMQTDCCDDSLECTDGMCTVPASEVGRNIEIYVPAALLVSGVLTVAGHELLLLDAKNRIQAVGEAFDFSKKDIQAIKNAYVDGIFKRGAGNDANLALARKAFADAIARAIYDAAFIKKTVSDLEKVYGSYRTMELVDNISQSVQILIQQKAGDVEGMETVVGALDPEVLFGSTSFLRVTGKACVVVGFIGTLVGHFMEGGRDMAKRAVAFARTLASKAEAIGQNDTPEAVDSDATVAYKIGTAFEVASNLPQNPDANATFISAAKAAATRAKVVATTLDPTTYPAGNKPSSDPVVAAATVALIYKVANDVEAPKSGTYSTMNDAFVGDPANMAKLYFDVMAVRFSEKLPVADMDMSNAMGDALSENSKIRVGTDDNKYSLAGSFAELFVEQNTTLNRSGVTPPLSAKVTAIANFWNTPLGEGGMPLSAKQAICQALGYSTDERDINKMNNEEIRQAIKNSYQYLDAIQITYPNGINGSIYDIPPTGYTMPDIFNFSVDALTVATAIITAKSKIVKSATNQPAKLVKPVVKKQVPVKSAPVR